MYEGEVRDWYARSPAERFVESQKLWEIFLLFGGDLEPEPDTQSPFHDNRFQSLAPCRENKLPEFNEGFLSRGAVSWLPGR